MAKPSESAKPYRDGARFVCRKRTELSAHTRSLQHIEPRFRVWIRAIAPKQRRHINGKTSVANPTRKSRDVRADARHLSHHDDTRTTTRDIDSPRRALQGDKPPIKIIERIVGCRFKSSIHGLYHASKAPR
jgi:hypothetical protein